MRVNVYREELTDDIEVVTKTPKNSRELYGVSFYLESSPKLHKTHDDDDRGAVILWGESPDKLLELLSKATTAVERFKRQNSK
jgi:hypothetical protein